MKFFGKIFPDNRNPSFKITCLWALNSKLYWSFSSLNQVISNGCNNFTNFFPKTPYLKISNPIVTKKLIFKFMYFLTNLCKINLGLFNHWFNSHRTHKVIASILSRFSKFNVWIIRINLKIIFQNLIQNRFLKPKSM